MCLITLKCFTTPCASTVSTTGSVECEKQYFERPKRVERSQGDSDCFFNQKYRTIRQIVCKRGLSATILDHKSRHKMAFLTIVISGEAVLPLH